MSTNLKPLQYLTVLYWYICSPPHHKEYIRLLNLGIKPRYACELTQKTEL